VPQFILLLLHRGVHAIHWNPEWPVNMLTSVELTRNVHKILVRGVNVPLPPEAKKILKISLQNGAF